MIRRLTLAGLTAALLLSGQELTGHTVLLQPIVLTRAAGDGTAKAKLREQLIDLPFRRRGLDIHILEPIEWSSGDLRDGMADVDVIVKAGTDDGIFRQPGRIANMCFADGIKGPITPGRLAKVPGWVGFQLQGNSLAPGRRAFGLVGELARNIGLSKTGWGSQIPAIITDGPNDEGFVNWVEGNPITESQARSVFKRPFVRETVKCLQGKDARKAYLGEAFEASYSRINRREIEAMTGKAVPKQWAGEALVTELRRRF